MPPAVGAALLALIACAGASPVRDERAEALRRREGVCAATNFVNPAGRRVRLQGCLRTGFAGTPFDNLRPRLVTELQAKAPDDADLTDWQVQLLRDGEPILNRALDAGPSHPRCSRFGWRCRQRVADVATIEGELGRGTYTLRYRLMSEEAYLGRKNTAELTIVLR